MQVNVSRYRCLFIGVLSFILGGCFLLPDDRPEFDKTVTIDDKGRKVTIYRTCKQNRLPLSIATRPSCHSERIVHNYCYPSIGGIECFDKPVAHRTLIERDL
jgi:hypothetical protein